MVRIGIVLLSVFSGLLISCASPKSTTAPATRPAARATLAEAFESGIITYQDWNWLGDVSVANDDAFEGRHSLRLSRTADNILTPTHLEGRWFGVVQGSYDVSLAIKTDLDSPDNSYNATVLLELSDRDGRTSNGPIIAEQDGRRGWRQVRKQVDIPASYQSARIKLVLNKAAGRAWIDDITIRKAISSKDPVIERLVFDTAQVGNLLYPTDSRTVKVTVHAHRQLTKSELLVTLVVRDYWGAEQGPPLTLDLIHSPWGIQTPLYERKIDLSPLNLQIGKYYELHGTVTKSDGSQFSNYTSFAILPEAVTNSMPAESIPFTGRTWDARIPLALHFMKRLGIRTGGVWGTWAPTPPFAASAPCMDEIERLGMGFITNTPAMSVETRAKGWDRYTDETMRAGVRNFYEKYKHIRPFIVNLGNEPHNKGDEIKPNIAAYKAIYEEFKRLDPNVIVVSTSVGPTEEFFKHGLGQYCDAYDFHVYGDSSQIRDIIEKQYPALFAKYGHKKPIWSTELGLDSHGMARLPVAIELVKKLTNFFAAGGANCSWFNMMYPDPDGTIAGSTAEAHNVFDCRYNKYAPKLEAVTNYNMVNGIADKKFVAEKVYANGVKAFLFRNEKGECFQVLYMDKGRADIGLPLAGVEAVKVTRIDGSISELHAGGKGVTLTAGVEPLLLTYSGPTTLPDALDKPLARLHDEAGPLVAGGASRIVFDSSYDGGRFKLITPYGEEQPGATMGGGTLIDLYCPADTVAREADLVLQVRDDAKRLVGELYRRPAITGKLLMTVIPVPATTGKPAGVKLAIRNNSGEPQPIKWSIELLGAKPVIDGRYPAKPQPADAHFVGPVEGTINIHGRKDGEVFVPMTKIDTHTSYFLRAKVKDATGREVVDERPVAGFVGVPKASSPITFDGVLNEPAWKQATVLKSDQLTQFFSFLKGDRRLHWTGPDDLSCTIRYLWDEQYLYVAVDVTDDVFGGPTKADADIWAQDGLQFLVDPMRTSSRKVGKYDYGVGQGKKGAQAWCFLSADNAAAPSGEVKDLKLAIKRADAKTGNTTYELAFPWSRLAPFKPSVGANLGFTLIVNEDDGQGRDSFMTWFGNAHTKDIDTVGDLILLGE